MQLVKFVPDQPPSISYRGYRLPKDIIAFAVRFYFRFPLGLRLVEEMLAPRGVSVTYETVQRWADKSGRACARRLRPLMPAGDHRWRLNKMVVKMNGRRHWL